MRRPRVILAAVAAALLSGALGGASLAATPKERLLDKQAEAQKVLGEVNQLDARFGATVEAWNGAKYELGLAQKELAGDQARLRAAEKQRRLAVKHVTDRVVALYESDPRPSTIAILLGATSLSGLLDELQAAHQVAAADHRLAAEATKVRDRYARAVRTLSATERRKQDAVEQLDTQRTQIGQLLAQRKSSLSSIQSEVATLKVEEARRQARLEAEAKARLAAEAAARKKAEDEAKARAAELAAAAAKKPKTTPKAPPAASPPATTTVSTSTTTTTSTPPPVQTVPSGPTSGGHPEAATIALRYLGVPYQWGG